MYVHLHVKYHFFCHSLIKLEFSQQSLQKYSNNKFQENMSSGSQGVPSGWTDRHDKAKSLLHTWERAEKG